MSRKLLMLLCYAGLMGCSTQESDVSIWLTDAPNPQISTALVTIDEIYLQGDDSRVVLRSEPFTTNLLSLSNDVALLVDEQPVPAGRYGQLRFVISGAAVEVVGSWYTTPDYDQLPAGAEVSGPLQTPSWSTSGFKVSMPDGALELEGSQRLLVVDFDVADSFGQQAGSRWVLRPALRAQDVTATGSLQVDVSATNGVDLAAVPLEVELFDAARRDEGTLPLVDRGDGVLTATFRYLDPRDSPFTIELLGPSGVSVVTDPPMPLTVGLESGASLSVSIDVDNLVFD